MLAFIRKIRKEPSRAFINFFRIEVFFGACFIIFLSLFSYHSKEIEFNIVFTLSTALVLIAFFLISFLFKDLIWLLRKLSFFTYFIALTYTIYVAYCNQYNLHSYSALMIGYLFYLITLYDLKAFIRENTILVLLILISLYLLEFKTIADIRIILFSLLLLSGFGAIMSFSRKFKADRIKKRSKLLNHIFNNSRQGLILVNTKGDTIKEINSTAIKILQVSTDEKLKGKNVKSFEFWNQKVFNEINDKHNLIVENNEGKLLTVKRTDFSIDQNGQYLLELKIYSDGKNYNESDELEKIKLISEENYENLFNNSASFICIINRDGIIVDVNKTITETSGYARSHFIGKKYSWYDAGDYENEREVYNKKAWNGETQIFEKAIKIKDDSIIDIEVILKRGKYLGEDVLISNSRDISKRKELEEKVALRTEVYKNLIENSSIAIAFTDMEGQFIEINKAFLKYLEYSEEEMLKMSLNDVLVDSSWEKEKENREKLLNGELLTKEYQRKLKTKTKKTKHALWKYMLQNSDLEGQPKMFLHQIVDVTAIVETRDKLKESEESYKNLFNYSNELLYMVDESNNLIDINQTVIDRYGYSKEEILSKNGLIFSAPGRNNMEEIAELVEEVWKGKVKRMLWWSITKSGEIFPKDLYMRKGKYFGKNILVLSGRDISQQFEYEKMLKDSRKKYKDLIDSSSWGILIFNDDKIVFTNKKALQILNISREEELLSKSQYDFVEKEKDIRIFKKRIEKLRDGKEIPLSEYTLIDGKGEEIVIELRAKLVEYEQEECVLVSFIDINDRKEIEKAKKKVIEAKTVNKNLKLQLEQNRLIQMRLQNEQSYSEGVIESSLDMIFTTNKKGELNMLNTAAKEKLGMTEEDYMGKTLNALFSSSLTSDKIVDELSKRKFYRGEVEMQKKNGECFTAYASFSYLFNVENDFLGTMGISRDISEIKKQEKEIKEQAAKLNTIIESSSHYFFTIDRNYRFTSINQRLKEDAKKSYGVDLKLKEPFFNLLDNLPAKTKQEYINIWSKNFTKCFNGHMVEFETENRSLNGESYFREVYLSPIYSEKGKVEEISGIGHDTTDKKLYEKELKKSLKEKEVLLQEVHHRVKNNMQVISSILNLQSGNVNDEKLLTILNDSQDRIRAMAAIHERLYRTKNFSDIKFSAYIKNLAENLVNSYEYGEAEIELKCELDEIFLTLDISIPCGLIVNELISNALKYAFIGREKGEIKIMLKKKKQEISIMVSDNGSGFSKDVDLKNIDSLGLQLVTTLVDQIEGKLKMNNESGTSFLITFTT